MKKCSACKEFKNESEFSKNKSKKDGLQNQCKDCKKISDKIYRQAHKEEAKVYYHENKQKLLIKQKIYDQTPKGKEVKTKAKKKYIKNNPEKRKALSILNDAIRYGKIKKPKHCSICGKTNCLINGHHTSYKKGDELKVIWCCHQCHKDLHNNLLIKKVS